MNNQYLLPANSKKSQLIFGLFTTMDMWLIAIGASLTVIMLIIINGSNPPLWQLLIAIAPVVISAGLVFPVPNYHNIFQFLTNIVLFYTGGRRYYWKGWCVKDGGNDK